MGTEEKISPQTDKHHFVVLFWNLILKWRFRLERGTHNYRWFHYSRQTRIVHLQNNHIEELEQSNLRRESFLKLGNIILKHDLNCTCIVDHLMSHPAHLDLSFKQKTGIKFSDSEKSHQSDWIFQSVRRHHGTF